jgi:thymidylate synthase
MTGAEDCNFGTVDQIQKVIDKLKNNPDDRRMLVVAWHPYHVDFCILSPCHFCFQFHTEELTLRERFDFWMKNYPEDYYKFRNDIRNDDIWNDDDVNQLADKFGVPKRRLNCHMNMRSTDIFLGLPFNIASYALLTSMVAQSVNMFVGELLVSFTDLHLYENHVEQIKLQKSRTPMELPTLKLNPEIKNLFDFKYQDIEILNYKSHPAIKAEVAV